MSEVLKTSSSTEAACQVNHHTALRGEKENNCPVLADSYTDDDDDDDVQLYYSGY